MMNDDADTPLCFVLSSIGEPGSPTRKRADGILDQMIRPALEDYRVERADHDTTPGMITDSIINNVINADLVVAELTDFNPNVMYELGIRHAFGEPSIQMYEGDPDELAFDIQGINTIIFEAELHDRDKIIPQIREAAEQIETRDGFDNPVGQAVSLQSIAASGDSDIEQLADAIYGLREQVSRLRGRGSSSVDLPTKESTIHSVSVSPASATLSRGATIQMAATISAPENVDTEIHWTSSDPEIASVTSEGKVTGESSGSTVITARPIANLGIAARAEVTVKGEASD